MAAYVAGLLLIISVACSPGRAACVYYSVWLYGTDGAYYAAGYTVGAGHVNDPLGVQVGTVDANLNIEDDQDNVIGYLAVDTP